MSDFEIWCIGIVTVGKRDMLAEVLKSIFGLLVLVVDTSFFLVIMIINCSKPLVILIKIWWSKWQDLQIYFGIVPFARYSLPLSSILFYCSNLVHNTHPIKIYHLYMLNVSTHKYNNKLHTGLTLEGDSGEEVAL